MISVYDTLKNLKTLLETETPQLLYDADLDYFDVYHIGASKDPQQKGLFLYQDSGHADYEQPTLSLIIHLQLFKCDEEISAKYTDIIKDYIWGLDVHELGFDLLESLDWDSYYDVNTRVAYSFIMPTWSQKTDDCDVRG